MYGLIYHVVGQAAYHQPSYHASQPALPDSPHDSLRIDPYRFFAQALHRPDHQGAIQQDHGLH